MAHRVTHGGDVEVLDDIALGLRRQGDRIDDVGARGSMLLEKLRAVWDGPDLEKFALEWRAAHRQVDAAHQAIRGFGKKLTLESESQRGASGGGSGSGGGRGFAPADGDEGAAFAPAGGDEDFAPAGQEFVPAGGGEAGLVSAVPARLTGEVISTVDSGGAQDGGWDAFAPADEDVLGPAAEGATTTGSPSSVTTASGLGLDLGLGDGLASGSGAGGETSGWLVLDRVDPTRTTDTPSTSEE